LLLPPLAPPVELPLSVGGDQVPKLKLPQDRACELLHMVFI